MVAKIRIARSVSTFGSSRFSPKKHIECRETGFPSYAIAEVHREGACSIEPSRVARALVELQKRVTIAAGAVAKVGAFGERSRCPDRFSGGKQQIVDLRAWQAGEADDEAGRAVAELQQHFPARTSVVELRTPVDVRS